VRLITRAAVGRMMGLGQREKFFPHRAVEGTRNVAREFEMLFLIRADRHMRRVIAEDIRRHQHGVGVEAEFGFGGAFQICGDLCQNILYYLRLHISEVFTRRLHFLKSCFQLKFPRS
jgi:hypothetical protein